MALQGLQGNVMDTEKQELHKLPNNYKEIPTSQQPVI